MPPWPRMPLDEQRFDVSVNDLGMPGLDGCGLTRGVCQMLKQAARRPWVCSRRATMGKSGWAGNDAGRLRAPVM